MPNPVKLNDDLYGQLDSVYQRRYDPTFSWGNMLSMFTMLPGLRGFWPMSSINENGALIDLSGQGRDLSRSAGYIDTNGVTPYYVMIDDYLYRSNEAGLDIIGTETYLSSSLRGLTIGGWFYLNSIAHGHNFALMGKWNITGNNRSYLLYFDDTANQIDMAISTDGTASIDTTGSVINAAQWYFCVGRFDPSSEVAIFVNGAKSTNIVGIPASLFSGTADFNLGARDNGSTWLIQGRASLGFLCASALPDTIIKALFAHSKALFGVR